MEEIRAYATLLRISPSTVIQKAGVGGGGTWSKWESGEGSPTLRTVDRLRRYMADNAPLEGGQATAEDAA